ENPTWKRQVGVDVEFLKSRNHSLDRRVIRYGEQLSGRTLLRRADGSDLAVRPGLSADPIDDFTSVLDLVRRPRAAPDAELSPGSTHIYQDHRIAVADEEALIIARALSFACAPVASEVEQSRDGRTRAQVLW